jgi:heme exporter protein B
LASIGLAAIGTLVGATTNWVCKRGNLVALLLLPLVWPVVLAAGEATCLAMSGDYTEPFFRWLKLLAAFDVTFATLGVLLFDFIMED